MPNAAPIRPRNLPEPSPAPAPQVDPPSEPEAQKPKWFKANTRVGKRALAFYTNPAAWRQFRRLCDDEGKSQQDFLIEALNDLFTKNNLQRIAD
jgi:hypothetical protein